MWVLVFPVCNTACFGIKSALELRPWPEFLKPALESGTGRYDRHHAFEARKICRCRCLFLFCGEADSMGFLILMNQVVYLARGLMYFAVVWHFRGCVPYRAVPYGAATSYIHSCASISECTDLSKCVLRTSLLFGRWTAVQRASLHVVSSYAPLEKCHTRPCIPLPLSFSCVLMSSGPQSGCTGSELFCFKRRLLWIFGDQRSR